MISLTRFLLKSVKERQKEKGKEKAKSPREKENEAGKVKRLKRRKRKQKRGNQKNMWVECFFKWRRPTSEKIVRPTASSDASSYFYPNLETTLKKSDFISVSFSGV